MASDFTYELEIVEDLDAEALEAIAALAAEIIIHARTHSEEKNDEPIPGLLQFKKKA